MNKIRKLEVVPLGTIVQSSYRARFFGKLVRVIPRKGGVPLWVVESVCTSDGRPYRKSFIKIYSAFWFEVVENVPSRLHTG